MEESEKRRERLRAMRVEATADVIPSSSSSQQTLTSTPLANPLLENQDSNTASTPSRFDFYTDPMAAYASNKQRPFTPRPHMSPSQCGPRNPGTHPSESHSHQFQNNCRPHQGMYQGGDPYYNPGPNPNPMGIRSQYPVHQGSPNFNSAQPSPGPNSGGGNWLNNNNPSAGPGYGGIPYPAYQGSPDFRPPFPPQGRGHWPNNSPSPSPSSGPGHEGYPQGMGQWSNNSRSLGPGPGRGGYPQGRGQWSNNSPGPGSGRGSGPSPYIGRGRGQDSNRMSPSPRYSGGRGRGRGYGDGQSRSLYNKSMVEDPWKSLTPIIWVGVKENDSRSSTSNQRFFQKTNAYQNSPSAKKPRVLNPGDAFNPKKGGSLADFLAESFDDAANV